MKAHLLFMPPQRGSFYPSKAKFHAIMSP